MTKTNATKNGSTKKRTTKSTATKSKPTMAKALAALAKLNKGALQKKYRAVFGKATKSDNVINLRAAIARKLAGDRSEETAKSHVDPRDTITFVPKVDRDPRLPPAGTWLERKHGDDVHKVKVLEEGFEYCGDRYRSLSGIAQKITGQVWNGFLWFGLIQRPTKGMAASKSASRAEARA